MAYTLTIQYKSIQGNADKQLEVGDIISVTYSKYEETNGTYRISVECFYIGLSKYLRW